MFNTIRQNLRSFLRIPESFTAGMPTISASLPTATLGGHPPEVLLVRPVTATPTAGAAPVRRALVAARGADGMTPHERLQLFESQIKLDFDYDGKVLAAASAADRGKALKDFAQFRKARLSGKTLKSLEGKVSSLPIVAKAGAGATVDDEGATPIPTPSDPGDVVGEVVEKLQQCLQQLKDLHPDVNADDADADEAQARLALAAGRKSEALKLLDSAVGKRGAKIVAKKNRSALLAKPSSRSRASALIRSGFASQPGVMALDVALGRAPRADFPAPGAAVPPVPPAAVATITSTAQDVDRIRSIEAEIKNIDAEYRKTGVYPPDAQARHATLSRQLRAERKKFHAS